MKISAHITLKEATKSVTAKRKGIDNTPNEDQIENMIYLANKIFEPLRDKLGSKPIGITSFFRSVELNTAIGGSKTSQHCKGEAMDIDADMYGGLTNFDIFHCIKDNFQFDQLIWEYGDNKNPDWVHVSIKGSNNRNQILIAYKENGKTKYKLWE